MKEDKSSICKYFNNFLGNFPENHIEEIWTSEDFKSLRQYAKYFKLSFNTFRRSLIRCLIQKFGKERAKIIYNKLWPTLQKKTKKKKQAFLKKLKLQLKLYYPNEIEKIDTRLKYAKEFGVDPNSITHWVMEYLKYKFSTCMRLDQALEYAQQVYNEIWTINLRISGGREIIDYYRIMKYVQSKNGKLITTEEEFDNMEEIISKRYIIIKCQKKHKWEILVSNLLYSESWCPYCYQLKCQEYLLNYMKAIFGIRFCSDTLTKAYGLKYKPGLGMLKFDGFCNNILVNGKKFKVACEYDGIQHDEYPNYFHSSLEEFEYAQKNDKMKIKHAKSNKTILIRIKEVQGFDKNCFEKNPDKVIKEIINQFNNQIKELYNIRDFRLKYLKNHDYLKKNVCKENKGSLEKFF